ELLSCLRVVGRRPSSFDPDIAALHPPELLKSLLECGVERRSFQVVLGIAHQNTNPAYPFGLLRARRERRCGSYAADKRYELPPSHSITSSAMENTPAGMVTPSACAVVTLITNSNLVDCNTGRSAGLAPLRMLPV